VLKGRKLRFRPFSHFAGFRLVRRAPRDSAAPRRAARPILRIHHGRIPRFRPFSHFAGFRLARRARRDSAAPRRAARASARPRVHCGSEAHAPEARRKISARWNSKNALGVAGAFDELPEPA